MAVNKNGIVVMGAVFVDIKGFPDDVYIPDGRNAGKVEYIHGGVSRNVVAVSYTHLTESLHFVIIQSMQVRTLKVAVCAMHEQ